MFKTLITILITLAITTQSFALSSTRPVENFAEIMRNCSNMVECHNRIVAETGNLQPTGEILLVNIYDMGGK